MEEGWEDGGAAGAAAVAAAPSSDRWYAVLLECGNYGAWAWDPWGLQCSIMAWVP